MAAVAAWSSSWSQRYMTASAVLFVKQSSVGSYDGLLLARKLIRRSSSCLDYLPMGKGLPVRALLSASVLSALLLAAVPILETLSMGPISEWPGNISKILCQEYLFSR